ncbi:MAG: carboxypeptidase regulatory-like domain-containing protein, partial [Prevotella sp.]|nr:carboxypeptidase regulatory-like domain-containing protein [Prevotella sp.]
MNDILDGDVFLIQRSLTGRLDDYEEIGSVMYDSTDSVYSFRDSTLIEALTPELIDKQLGIPLVRYRVARGASMQLWGVHQNPAIAYVQPQFSSLALLVPEIPSASWSDEEAHKALVKWNYEAGADDRIFVWDSRAEMKLTIRMFNKKGEEIGTQTEELTPDDIVARQKEVRLTRSCSDYRFEISMDAKKSPIGEGTGDIFVTIADKTQFDAFVSRVNGGETSLNAILMADIDTGSNVTIAADADKPYCGNFNGNGHSITIDYQMHSDVAGPFRNVGHGAVIANLTTKGMITTPEKYAGGIVGCVKGGIVSIENCRASLTINMTRLMDDCSHGGVIGLVEGSADGLPTTTYVSNTLFDGKYVHDNSTTYFVTNLSGFVGWRRASAFVQLAGCHFAQQDNYRGAEKGNSHTFMRGEADGATRGIIQECTYKTPFAIVEGRQSDTAPQNACWDNGLPKALVKSFGQLLMRSMTAESSIIHDLYYENLGHIDTESLKAEMQQSSVVLSWKNKDDTPVDYYEVWRRDAQSKDSICIATQLTEMSYEDKTTSPVHTYYYRVRGVNSCEGLSYEDTKAVEGHCRPTGLVQGYLRFADGTGIPGQTIAITSADRTVNETTTTDESGFFSKGGLPYIGGTETTYSIAPQLNGFSDVQPLTFGTEPGGNMVTGVVFVMEKSVKFSGYVQYNGTSIPVQGVKFLVDGREVHSAGGPIVSDHEGQ